MDVGGQTVCPGHFMAREKALVFFELEAGWALELAWMFWRKIVLFLRPRFEPHIFHHKSY
jgi:hypothetical protein